jgi:hypothetical protein
MNRFFYATLCALFFASFASTVVNSNLAPAAAAEAQVGRAHITPQTRNEQASQSTLLLAENKKALLPIIISAKAGKNTRAVADELAAILAKITDANFEVKAGDGSVGIVLGTLEEFPHPELEDALEIYNGFDGREAFAIRTGNDRVLLLGATELGASHAAFRFLEEIGYRHFFPHASWEVVPKIEKLSFHKNITDRPSILARDIWFEAGPGGSQQFRDYEKWKRHNLHAQSFVINAGHNMDSVRYLHKAEFDAHPEYLALVKDKNGNLVRKGPQLELSNPAVRQMIVDYAVGYFKKYPNADMVSIDPADNTSHSISEESLAMGSVSDRVFGMANEVAVALRKAYPGQNKMVGLYSYNAHWDPPSFKLEPNVHVLMAGLGQGELTPEERDQVWPQRTQNLGLYDYYSVWLWTYDKLPGSFVNNIHEMQQRMQKRVAMGTISVSAESTSSWGPNGRGYYIANKLLWNPDIKVDDWTQDFYDKAFGPAAAPVKRFYERLEPAKAKFLSKGLMGAALRDLKEASTLAAGHPEIIARLDQLKLNMHYNYLTWMKSRDPLAAPRQADRDALQREILTHYFRTREYALTSWELARQIWGKNKREDRDNEPWMVREPYSREEIDNKFEEALAYFKPVELGPTTEYSSKLVPIVWSATARGAAEAAVPSEQSYQGAANYFFYSVKGEPLEFRTWAGNAWGGINRFKITDADGKEITGGTLPNQQITEHKIQVPAPGLYRMNYNDNGSYWSISVNAGKPSTIPNGQEQDFRNNKVMQDMFFYVPKGVKVLEYFYTKTAFHPGGPHQVIDPTGNIATAFVAGQPVQTVSVNGDWVKVTIPPGMDGKLWRFRNPVLGRFWFNNAPNFIAASPEALLIPRELAMKDGLKILQ